MRLSKPSALSSNLNRWSTEGDKGFMMLRSLSIATDMSDVLDGLIDGLVVGLIGLVGHMEKTQTDAENGKKRAFKTTNHTTPREL